MSRPLRRALGTAALLTVLFVDSACGRGTGGGHDVTAGVPSISAGRSDLAPSPGGESVPYALLESPGWTLSTAVDPPSDHLLADIEPVPSDWYAEYVRFVPIPGGVRGLGIKLTGLSAGLDTYRTALEALGVSFESVDTALGAGLMGTTAEDGARPVAVAVPLGSTTLEMLSYELSGDELVALVADLGLVDGAGWHAAGGQVR